MKRFFASAIFAVLLLAEQQAGAQDQKEVIATQSAKIEQMLNYINSYYLDSLNINDFTESILKEIMQKLDPHSVYIPETDVDAANSDLVGNFEGVGVEFTILRDTLNVVNTIAGGPCELVGIRARDRVVSVDGKQISGPGLNNSKVFSLLRGPKGSKVKLGVLRNGEKEVLDFEVTRDKIPVNSVDAAFLAEKDIMYIKLARFAANSMSEIMDCFRPGRILTTMPKGIIIDLRGNGGGFMYTALQLSDQFLQQGQLILYAEGSKFPRMEEKATGKGFLKKVPLVVLIDEYSASSSEIFAGAMQDWDRGIIIGRRSFGKGLVQSQLPLKDGSMIRLTTSRYHTPSGRVVQSPYEKGHSEDYYKALSTRVSTGEFFSKDSIHIPDSLAFKTLRTGRTVYGGGGIIPDIFIPADTSFVTPFYEKIVHAGLLTDFMNDYCDRNLTRLKQSYTETKGFIVGYTKPPFEEFLQYAAKKDVKPSPEDLKLSGDILKRQMKSFLARRIFDTSAYYQVMLPNYDPCYEQAIEVLNNWQKYQRLFEQKQ